mmetsp:Transcript_33984/g.82427  ORF Transcript_33984/g.82427 Transcript_33984/m.82427 type:complete len:533 (-) Transcript_33984:175-1773(-)
MEKENRELFLRPPSSRRTSMKQIPLNHGDGRSRQALLPIVSQKEKRHHVTRDNGKPPKKRKKIDDGPNTVLVYNLSKDTECGRFSEFVTTILSEMHGEVVDVVGCEVRASKSHGRHTAFVTFRKAEHCELCLSLNGVKFTKKKLYARTYASVSCKASKSSKQQKKVRDKQQLCIASLCGMCCHGINGNSCYNAHSVVDMKLYHDTILSENRTIYINQIDLSTDQKNSYLLEKEIRQRFNEHDIVPFLTALHFRKDRGDAIIEFADIRHAKRARDILSTFASVHPWTKEYQAAFVDYFHNGMSSHIRVQEWERQPVPPPNDEVYPSKNLDSSYSRDLRRMEDKLDDLRYENDELRRDYDDLRWKYDRLHQKCYGDSKSSNHDYRHGGRDIDDCERDNNRHTSEQSRKQTFDLQWRLDRKSYEKEILEKESEMLKERLKQLEDAQQIVPKVENISKDLQSRLDQAMSKNEELTGTLEKTHRHVQNLESEKTSLSTTISSLQMENESMQEEMEQMKMNHAMELGFAEGEESDASH